jgi:hypothetical protein
MRLERVLQRSPGWPSSAGATLRPIPLLLMIGMISGAGLAGR